MGNPVLCRVFKKRMALSELPHIFLSIGLAETREGSAKIRIRPNLAALQSDLDGRC